MSTGSSVDGRLGPVGVLGAGTMGAGIALVFARAGIPVRVWDVSADAVSAGRGRIESFLDEGIRRGKLTTDERAATLARVGLGVDLAALADCETVVEAVVEQADTKRAVFAEVAKVVSRDTVIATNTSALSVTALAVGVPRPERFAGLHFFNPAPLMPLVEVVAALQTAPATLTALTELCRAAGKDPITVRDRPGFLVNRILMPYLNDVVQAYDDGVATAEDIDTAVRLGLGHPMGPLELLDLIGLDVHAHATTAAYEATHDPAFAPPPLLGRMVEAGWHGHKSGRGLRAAADAAQEGSQ